MRLDGQVIANGRLDVLGHHHALGFPFELFGVVHLTEKVLHHDFCLGTNGAPVAFPT